MMAGTANADTSTSNSDLTVDPVLYSAARFDTFFCHWIFNGRLGYTAPATKRGTPPRPPCSRSKRSTHSGAGSWEKKGMKNDLPSFFGSHWAQSFDVDAARSFELGRNKSQQCLRLWRVR